MRIIRYIFLQFFDCPARIELYEMACTVQLSQKSGYEKSSPQDGEDVPFIYIPRAAL